MLYSMLCSSCLIIHNLTSILCVTLRLHSLNIDAALCFIDILPVEDMQQLRIKDSFYTTRMRFWKKHRRVDSEVQSKR